MADRTLIEWTEATWNVVTGCTRVSPGCLRCYIERTMPFRMTGRRFDGPGVGATTGVLLHPDRLELPLRWRRPRRVFVCSLADLLHEAVPDAFVAKVFAVMGLARRHTFQVLTKRHGRLRSLLSRPGFRQEVAAAATDIIGRDARRRVDVTGWTPLHELPNRVLLPPWPLPNVWVGVSTETQRWAQRRVSALLDTPAAVRWISAEPLLEPLRLAATDTDALVDGGLDWVVAGGESGPGCRPVDLDWIRGLRDECVAANIPFLFKQVGGAYPSAGGRLLDGRTWDQYPAPLAVAS